MKLLFIDTETTELSPQSGQIIEITGIVVDFNPGAFEYSVVDSFDSTVALRGKMEEKITRITGITELELATAPDIRAVQEKWSEWVLSQNSISAIVGHSIDFDLGFLKYEKWLLPEEYMIIDTLNLAKIYLPNYSAINLEYLVEKLKLDTNIKDESDGSRPLVAHRSYYDTRVCVDLFATLVRKISQIGLPDILQKYISQRFLPLQIIFYPKTSTLNIPKINELLSIDLPLPHSLILSQKLVIASLNQSQSFEFPLKFHSQGKASFAFGAVVDEILTTTNPDIPKSLVQTTIPRFEGIISRISGVLEQTTNISKIVELADWLWQIHTQPENLHPATLPLQKLISVYEFFIFSMQNVWQKSEYQYQPGTMRAVDKPIYDKFSNITELLEELKVALAEPFQDIFSQYLAAKLLELISPTTLIADVSYIFRYFKNNFTVSQQRRGYTVRNYVEELLSAVPTPKAQTYLDHDDFMLLLGWLRVEDIFQKYDCEIVYESGDFKVHDSTLSLEEFYREKLAETQVAVQPILFLCGQNSTLKDSQKVLTQNFEVKDYLLLGESGSLTKIGSKLVRGFSGLLVTKMSDYYYFLHLPEVPDFAEIWLINPPYLWVHHSLNHVDAVELKRIFLTGHLSYISQTSGKTVQYLKGYL
jgi:DNA polymerase III epsilon subunit-like protein